MNEQAHLARQRRAERTELSREEFLRLFKEEYAHLRDMGREFAQEHRKIAGRLDLDSFEVADPYVERLLEGFAFLTARVRMQLDAEQPKLIAQLLEALYPQFLAPLPSMMVLQLAVDVNHPNLAHGHPVPRDTPVHALLPRGRDTHCEFRTAMPVTLRPLTLLQVQYFSRAADLGLARLPDAAAAQGGLRIRLRAGGGLKLAQLDMDRLAFYISAPDDVAMRLHELVLGACLGSLVAESPTPAAPTPIAGRWRGPASVQPLGFSDEEALLPASLRVFSGHRLLQEVAVLPQRLLFFELSDLKSRLAGLPGAEAELVLLFNRPDADLEARVDGGCLALHCTPAINLFSKRLKPVVLGPGAWEHHLVPDPTRTMDFEVHSIDTVTGHGPQGPRVFRPLYAGRHDTGAQDAHGYFTTRRLQRTLSERQEQQGARVPGYLGEEVFLSLQDGSHGPYRDDLRQLSVTAWVTNRDLPVLLPLGGGSSTEPVWKLDATGPVRAVHCLRGPTRPVSRQATGALGWQLVTQLTQNQLALGPDAEANAALLRELMLLCGPPNDAAWRDQARGLRSLKAEPQVRRLPVPGPLSFGSGVALTLDVDEPAFQGSSAFLLASVFDVFFARHAAINSFSQLSLRSAQRGQVHRWPPRPGLGPLL